MKPKILFQLTVADYFLFFSFSLFFIIFFQYYHHSKFLLKVLCQYSSPCLFLLVLLIFNQIQLTVEFFSSCSSLKFNSYTFSLIQLAYFLFSSIFSEYKISTNFLLYSYFKTPIASVILSQRILIAYQNCGLIIVNIQLCVQLAKILIYCRCLYFIMSLVKLLNVQSESQIQKNTISLSET